MRFNDGQMRGAFADSRAKGRGRLVLAILAWLGMTLPGAAQAGHYHIQQYTELEGVPGSTVYAAAQDSQGCLWLAMRTGIARYDGLEWRTDGVEQGLPVAPHGDLAVDHHGRIWALALAMPVRVSHRERDGWRTLPMPRANRAGDTVALALGRDTADRVLAAVISGDGGIDIWQGETWHSLRITGPDIQPVAMAWQGDVLHLATMDGLYTVLDVPEGGRPMRDPRVPAGPIYAVLPAGNDGALRLAGQGWLGELGPDGFTLQERLPALRFHHAQHGIAAALDHIGGLYLGDAFSVLYHHPDLGLESLGKDEGLVSNGVSDLLVDRGGHVWFANLRGLSKLVSRRFTSFDQSDGLLDDEVSAVLQRRDGTMILGHEGGLTIMEHVLRPVPLADRADRWLRVTDLEEAVDGAVWAALGNGGLVRLDPDGVPRHIEAAELLLTAIYTVKQDRRGRVWIGGNGGVYRLEGDRCVRQPLGPDAPAMRLVIRRLHLADDGSLYATTSRDGVFRIHDGGTEQWLAPGETGLNSTYGVLELPDGEVWVGTSGGLGRLTAGVIEEVSAPAPEIRRPVYALAADEDGRLWIGTDNGVQAWDGSTLREFTVRDGLIGSEVNRDAMTLDDRGRLWIGTDRGVSIHDERFVDHRSTEPDIWIHGYQVDGRRRVADEALDLPAGTDELVVQFRSASFHDEKRLRFRTFLEGFDPDWRPAEQRPSQSIRYTNLPAGRYRFHVQAQDVRGHRSAVATSADIVVHPPVWQRPWFVGLVAAASLGLVWLAFALVQGRRYNRQLAAEVRERTAELAASEDTVRAESLRLAAVLESISDGVVTLDADGRITLHNTAAAGLLAPRSGALAGRPLAEVAPGMAANIGDARRTVDRDAAGPQFSCCLETLAGAPLDLECSVAPLSGAAGPGLVVAFRDVTDRRRAEQERLRAQRLESLGLLAGGLAHDFNNLLAVILGNVSVLEISPELSGDDRHGLAGIRSATQRAQGLTAQLLTFARGGAPRRELIDLGPLLREAAARTLVGTGTVADLDLPADLWPAEVDAAQIGQLISQLLLNAVQAMPDGGRIRLGARNLAADLDRGPTVAITVADEGPGIAPEILDRIFEPYFSTRDGGSGLGLAIAYSVASRHEGTLAVTSHPGRGAEFVLRLPAMATEAAAPAPALTAASPETAGSGRILVLDDEDDLRILLVRILERLGFEAEGVAEGEAAVAAYAEALRAGRPFRAVIMDLTIPGGLGGMDALARLRELDPQVCAIVASGYSSDPVMSDHARYGFAGALRKPFDRQELAAVLARVLG